MQLMRKFCCTGLLLLLVVGLSACEKKAQNTNAAGEVVSNSVVLQIWTTEQKPFFDSLGREFSSVIGAPNLRFNVIQFDDALVMHDMLLNKLAEGEGPDIIYTSGEWIANNPKKLSPAVVDDSFNIDRFKNTFVQSATQTLTRGSQTILAVPMAVDTLALVFNDEHIADRLPDKNFPGRTWDEILEDATVLTKKDNSFERFNVSGIALGRADNINYAGQIMENMMLQFGVQFFDPTQTLATFDNAETVLEGGRRVNSGEEAMDYYTSFADERFKNHTWNSYLAKSDSPYKDFEPFALGKTSMIFAYARDLPVLQDLIDELDGRGQNPITDNNIRVAYLPQIEDPQVSPNRTVVADVTALAVTRDTQYPDTAWRFLKFAIQRDNLQKWHEETLLPSPRVDLLTEQEQLPLIGIYVRQAKFAEANLMPLPKLLFYESIKPGIQAINEGRMSSSKALETAAFALTQIRQKQIELNKVVNP